jgi:hypothetical protein
LDDDAPSGRWTAEPARNGNIALHLVRRGSIRPDRWLHATTRRHPVHRLCPKRRSKTCSGRAVYCAA